MRSLRTHTNYGMVSHINALVRVRPLLPREFAQTTSEAVAVYEVTVLPAALVHAWRARLRHRLTMQDHRIRACKDNTVLESDFDEVLGQDATQSQVFDRQGHSMLPSTPYEMRI